MTSLPTLAKEKLSKAARRIHNLPWAFARAYEASPFYTILWAGTTVVKALIPVGAMFIAKVTVNSLAATFSKNPTWEEIQTTLMYVGAAACLWILSLGSTLLCQYAAGAHHEVVFDSMTVILQRKASTLDLSFFDRSNYYDEVSGHKCWVGINP